MQAQAQSPAQSPLQSPVQRANDLAAVVAQVMTRVVTKVDQRLRGWSYALYTDVTNSTQAVADRVSLIHTAISTECDDDSSDDVEGIIMPKHVAALLDQLRAQRPDLYALLRDGGQELNDADVTEVPKVVAKHMRGVLAAAAAPPATA